MYKVYKYIDADGDTTYLLSKGFTFIEVMEEIDFIETLFENPLENYNVKYVTSSDDKGYLYNVLCEFSIPHWEQPFVKGGGR